MLTPYADHLFFYSFPNVRASYLPDESGRTMSCAPTRAEDRLLPQTVTEPGARRRIPPDGTDGGHVRESLVSGGSAVVSNGSVIGAVFAVSARRRCSFCSRK
jgi:hypothetical protein